MAYVFLQLFHLESSCSQAQKALNVDQLEELKRLTKINQVLKEKNIKLKSISTENQFKNIIVGTAGLFAGLSLKR